MSPFKNLIDMLYPIGRGFIDFTDKDYSNWLGLKWERELLGLTPIGINPNDEDFNKIGNTLGEKTHTMTEEELFEHTHNTYMVNKNNGGYNKDNPNNNNVTLNYNDENVRVLMSENPTGYWSTLLQDSVGKSKPFNIIQPSKVVAYWKRVA